jgi:hypothetical protein
MSQPLPLEPPRHIHYCNDVEDSDTCFDRGYCICECGATAPVITGKRFRRRARPRGRMDSPGRCKPITKRSSSMKTEQATNGKFGGGGGAVKSERLGTVGRCPDPNCGGWLTPKTDGNGGLKDVCDKCHRSVAVSQRVAQPAAPARAVTEGRPCPVEGCPGRVDVGRSCQCCNRRAAWEAEHAPKKSCEICAGDITGARKRCPPCAKLFTKVSTLKKKEEVLA